MKKILTGLIIGLITVIIVPSALAIVIQPTSKFNDVKDTDWFFYDVIDMEKYGIIKGYDDGTFRPDRSVSRAEVATIISRTYKKLNNTAQVNSLQAQIEAMQAKMSTLNFAAECYYDGKWYQENDDVTLTSEKKGVINYSNSQLATCTCQKGGALLCNTPVTL